MKKISTIILFCLWIPLLYCQPKLEFEKKYYDFGEIKEEGGKVTGRFTFTNTGDSNLILTTVRPGCGCTAADYTKTPIAPQEKGYIDVIFDPYNRPGGFTKNIRIYTNEPIFNNPQNPPHLIYIKGFVLKRPPTIYELAGYTSGYGVMRMKRNSCRFIVKNNETYIDTIHFKNFDTKSVEFTSIRYPAFVEELSRSFDTKIEADKEGYIVVQYNANQRNRWGKCSDPISFTTTDSIEPNKVFVFNAEIREDFSYLKPDSPLPIMQLSAADISFDKLKKGEKFEYTVIISNTGEEDLIIRDISTNLNAIKFTLPKNVIRPKQSTNLHIVFDSNLRIGKQNGYIEIICNDPNQANSYIRLFGEVIQ